MFVFNGKNNNFEYLTMVILSEQRHERVIVDLGAMVSDILLYTVSKDDANPRLRKPNFKTLHIFNNSSTFVNLA